MTFNPASSFDSLVNWLYDMILKHSAPGFLVGLSGTDSLVTFLAASKAFEKCGKPERVLGVHFAPSEDFLYDHPEAEVHTWFRDEIIPWLVKQAPGAKVELDTSIDWRCDGLRWGALMDLSVVSNIKRRTMRLPEEQYWVVGTRNRTENILLNYSNVSTAVSLQPLIHLWKREILQLSEHLCIPQIAIAKSCETDCICGRMALAANHIPEMDLILQGAAEKVPAELRAQLTKFIDAQIAKNSFKKQIPYTPNLYVLQFESGSLDLKKFNHHNHMYVAWQYLKALSSLEVAVERYTKFLRPLLDSAGQSHRFNMQLTVRYFRQLAEAMKVCPTDSFEELVEKCPSVLNKISA